MQNFAPWGFSAEQFWQRIDLPVDQATSPSCITGRREGAAGCGRGSRFVPSPHRAVGTVLGGGEGMRKKSAAGDRLTRAYSVDRSGASLSTRFLNLLRCSARKIKSA